MKKQSAGILPYKLVKKQLFFFIAHPGGPFFRNKDDGHWSIVKGELEEGEEPFTGAIREFKEETGLAIEGDFIELTPIKQKSGKLVHAWAIETDFSTENIQSNTFTIEWPPKSGKQVAFPELDKFEWFDMEMAMRKLLPAQVGLVVELVELLKISQ